MDDGMYALDLLISILGTALGSVSLIFAGVKGHQHLEKKKKERRKQEEERLEREKDQEMQDLQGELELTRQEEASYRALLQEDHELEIRETFAERLDAASNKISELVQALEDHGVRKYAVVYEKDEFGIHYLIPCLPKLAPGKHGKPTALTHRGEYFVLGAQIRGCPSGDACDGVFEITSDSGLEARFFTQYSDADDWIDRRTARKRPTQRPGPPR